MSNKKLEAVESEELNRLRALAEKVVKNGHWEAGCACGKCCLATEAEIALGRTPRKRQHWFGIAEGPE